jgi:hypothetical protein
MGPTSMMDLTTMAKSSVRGLPLKIIMKICRHQLTEKEMEAGSSRLDNDHDIYCIAYYRQSMLFYIKF